MSQNSKKKLHIPTSKAGKILTNLLVTLAVGGAYFYVSLPALNLQSNDFYSFMILLCVVYVVSALITSGFKGHFYFSIVTINISTIIIVLIFINSINNSFC